MRRARRIGTFIGVGAVGYVIDLALFNALHPVMNPLLAKVLATLAAICSNYVGNALITWRDSTRRTTAREVALFVFFSLVGLGMSVACLWASRGLGFTSQLDDNVSANVIGLGAGTVFRYWAYRRWVFRSERTPAPVPASEDQADLRLA